jgi:DNA (cytosine-5)-methyltransferase 1
MRISSQSDTPAPLFQGTAPCYSADPELEGVPTPQDDLKMISLFSGGGGMDLGLESVGFSTLFATDIDYHSCQTLEKGRVTASELKKPFLKHAKIRQADVRELSGKALLKELGLKPGEIDLLCGGPPCQAFSVFGKRQGSLDPRGRLLAEYLRILGEVKPKAFVFENVYGLLTIEGGAVFEQLCKELESPLPNLKYTLSVFRLNAVSYGVPQFRDRVFIIGHRSGKKVPAIPALCSDDPSSIAFRTVKDALRGMPHKTGSFHNHIGRKHSERIVTRYASMNPGERDRHTRINKLDVTKPSFTIIVGSDKGGGKGHIHPVQAREVTPRESARIQTFPDWWAFSGTSRHPIRQVGNAVPPLLAAAIGNEIRHHLFGRPRVKFNEVVSLLNQQHLFERK